MIKMLIFMMFAVTFSYASYCGDIYGTPGIDNIENKIGDVVCSVNGTVVTYAGDDNVTIIGDTQGVVDMGSGINTLSISGSARATLSFGSDNDAITVGDNAKAIYTRAGNDSVSIAGDTLGEIDLGNGNDILNINGNVNGTISARNGDDSITIGGNLNAVTYLNAGDDTIQIDGTINAIIDGGYGYDTIIINHYTQLDFDNNIDGIRDKIIYFENIIFKDKTFSSSKFSLSSSSSCSDIYGTSGDDTESRTCNVTGNIVMYSGDDSVTIMGDTLGVVDMGSGTNTLIVSGSTQDTLSFGSDDDRVTIGGSTKGSVYTRAGRDTVSIEGNTSGEIDLGNGNDRLSIGGNTNSIIATRADNDSIIIKGNVNAAIYLNAGDDTIQIDGTINAGIDGGDGYDTIIIGHYTQTDYDSNVDNIKDKITHFENIIFASSSSSLVDNIKDKITNFKNIIFASSPSSLMANQTPIKILNNELSIGITTVSFSPITSTFDNVTLHLCSDSNITNFYHIAGAIDTSSIKDSISEDANISIVVTDIVKGNSLTLKILNAKIITDKNTHTMLIQLFHSNGASISLSNVGLENFSQIDNHTRVSIAIPDDSLTFRGFDFNLETIVNSLGISNLNVAKIRTTLDELNVYLKQTRTYQVTFMLSSAAQFEFTNLTGKMSVAYNNICTPESCGDIYGTSGNDTENKTCNVTGTIIMYNGNDSVTIIGNTLGIVDMGSGSNTLHISGSTQDTLSFGSDNDIVIVGGSTNGAVYTRAGNDTISIEGNISGEIDSGNGNDRLSIGGNVDETIAMRAGNDTLIIGGNLNEVTYLNAGDDSVEINGTINAEIDGGYGNDTITINHYTQANYDNNVDNIKDKITHFENIVFKSNSSLSDSYKTINNDTLSKVCTVNGTVSKSLFVSLDGTDDATGDINNPFKTIYKAIEKARDLKEYSVNIFLRNGVYILDKSISIKKMDSRTLDTPLIIQAYKDENVTLLGAKKITNFRKVVSLDKAYPLLSSIAKDSVLVSDLEELGIDNLTEPIYYHSTQNWIYSNELFLGEDKVKFSHYPKNRVLNFLSDGSSHNYTQNHEDDNKTIVYSNNRAEDISIINSWKYETNLYTYARWKYDWSDSRTKIDFIDFNKTVINLHNMPYNGYQQDSLNSSYKGLGFYVYNIASALDENSYYIDYQNEMLYYYPKSEEKKPKYISYLNNIINITNSSYITLYNIKLSIAKENAINITHSKDINITDCTINNISGKAIYLSDVNYSSISDNNISKIGAIGIYASSGDRNNLINANINISNNNISKVGQIVKYYTPGIEILGVGNKVVKNNIYDLPHIAILFKGNNHIIDGNIIHNVVQNAHDAGAIYAGQDWSQRGTIIRNNFLYNIRGENNYGAAGIYLDDLYSGTVVEDNILYNIYRAVLIGGGRDNIVNKNLIVKCRVGLHTDARGLRWYDSDEKAKIHMGYILDKVPWQSQLWQETYPELFTIYDNSPRLPLGNIISNNKIIQTLYPKEYSNNSEQYLELKDNNISKDNGGIIKDSNDFTTSKEFENYLINQFR